MNRWCLATEGWRIDPGRCCRSCRPPPCRTFRCDMSPSAWCSCLSTRSLSQLSQFISPIKTKFHSFDFTQSMWLPVTRGTARNSLQGSRVSRSVSHTAALCSRLGSVAKTTVVGLRTSLTYAWPMFDGWPLHGYSVRHGSGQLSIPSLRAR